MKAKRKRHSAAFKAKVGFEALVGLKTVSQLAREYGVHPTQVTQWRATIRDHMPELFEPGQPGTEDQEQLIAQLHQKIGQLTVDLDWLKKKSRQNWGFNMRTDRPRSAGQPPAPVRAAGGVPWQLLLPMLSGDGGEPGADAALGPDASGASGLWEPQVNGALAPGRFVDQPQAGGAATALDGNRGDLCQATDESAGARPPDLSVSVARFGGDRAGSGLVFGHHLCAYGHGVY